MSASPVPLEAPATGAVPAPGAGHQPTGRTGPAGAPATGADQMPRVTAEWLELREAADAAARAVELVDRVRRHLAGSTRTVIHDLGCGHGSMGRWLAPQIPGRQHWIMYDRDPDLLGPAAARMVDRAADGAEVTVETRQRDISTLTADDLDGAGLVTGSALLDLLTAAEVDAIAAACVGARCPALFTISVVGRVDLTPADPLDADIAAAFNAHQRLTVAGRRLLGPDAVDAAIGAFTRRGASVLAQPSPWRLGADERDLVRAWLEGWLGAACEQRPGLAGPAQAYADRRLADAAAARLRVVVHHTDLLAGCD